MKSLLAWHLLFLSFYFLMSAQVRLGTQSYQDQVPKVFILNKHPGRLIGHLRYFCHSNLL